MMQILSNINIIPRIREAAICRVFEQLSDIFNTFGLVTDMKPYEHTSEHFKNLSQGSSSSVLIGEPGFLTVGI